MCLSSILKAHRRPSGYATSLESVEAFVKANKHLPGVQSRAEIEQRALERERKCAHQPEVEELYLHTIEQQKGIQESKDELNQKVNALEQKAVPCGKFWINSCTGFHNGTENVPTEAYCACKKTIVLSLIERMTIVRLMFFLLFFALIERLNGSISQTTSTRYTPSRNQKKDTISSFLSIGIDFVF